MEDDSNKMTFLSHFNELRRRLLTCVIALVITIVLSFAFSQRIAEFLAEPIGGLSAMRSIDVTENVTAFMKISLLVGVILAFPIIVYEIAAFVMPGLTSRERKWVWLAIPLATFFFLSGVTFSYLVMLPAALPFLINFMGIATAPRPSTYFGFVLNLMFWVGICFELPLIVFVLARLHIVSARQLAKQWRIAILICAVAAAVITPTPDPVNMGLMMLPLFLLYLISILFAYFAWRKPKETASEDESSSESA